MRHGRTILVLVLAALAAAGCTLTPSFSAGSVPASLKSEPESQLYYPGSAVQSISGQEAYCYRGNTDAGWVSASVVTKLTTSATADAVFKWYDAKLGSLGWPGTGGTLHTDVMEYYRGAWPPENDYTPGATFVIYNDGQASGKTQYRTLLKEGGQSGSRSCQPAH